MTLLDRDIIKAFECCTKIEEGESLKLCFECPMFEEDVDNCTASLFRAVLDLINRQQTEIEDLKADKEALINGQITLQKKLPKVTMDRFEKNIKDVNFTLGQTFEIQCALEKTLKELTEGNDGK